MGLQPGFEKVIMLQSRGRKVRTSRGLSPGLSENLNKSYWFAQMSSSGSSGYDSTATTSGLLGCRSSSSEKSSLQDAKETSMSRNWAFLETSMVDDADCFLPRCQQE